MTVFRSPAVPKPAVYQIDAFSAPIDPDDKEQKPALAAIRMHKQKNDKDTANPEHKGRNSLA